MMNDGKKCKYGFGALLIVAGGLLIANNFYDLGLTEYILSWKTLLIVIGLGNIISSKDKIFGAVLVAVGGLGHYGNHIGVSFWGIMGTYWPVFLVIIGLGTILKAFGLWKDTEETHQSCKTGDKGTEEESRDWSEITTAFSGTSKRITSEFFKGAQIVNVFGGTELDLTQTKMVEGKAVIEVFCMFGGVEIRVPQETNVSMKAVAVFGGSDDDRVKVPQESIDFSQNLEIQGLVLFGGLELKS